MRLFAVIILLQISSWVQSATLMCSFKILSDGYNCEIFSDFSQKNVTITSINGRHMKGKSNSNVDVLLMIRNSKYLPTNMCKFFENVNLFEIKQTDVRQISKPIFAGCGKLKTIQIKWTLVSSLPEDVFSDLVNLENLDLSENRIEVLPTQLFKNNQKLQAIKFNGNLLRIINVILPISVTSAAFRFNPCIDSEFAQSLSSVDSLVSEIDQKCSDDKYNEVKEKLQKEIEKQNLNIIRLKYENENLKMTEKNTKAEVAACNSTIELMQFSKIGLSIEVAHLRVENSKKTEEIQLLTSNHTTQNDKIEELFANITSLTEAQQQSLNEPSLKQKDLEKCTSDFQNITELYLSLSKDLDAKRNESDVLSGKIRTLEEKIMRMTNDNDTVSRNCSAQIKKLELDFNEKSYKFSEISKRFESSQIEKQELVHKLEGFKESDGETENRMKFVIGFLLIVTAGLVFIVARRFKKSRTIGEDKILLDERFN